MKTHELKILIPKNFLNFKVTSSLIGLSYLKDFSMKAFENIIETRCVCETLMPMQRPFFQKDLDIWPWPWKMTLTLVLKKGIYPKEHVKYDSSITCHLKAIANVKVLQTNKRTGQKHIPSIDRGHKNKANCRRLDLLVLHFSTCK